MVMLGVGVSIVTDLDFDLLSAVCPGLWLLVCDTCLCSN